MPAWKALNNGGDEQIFFACLAYTSRQMRATLHTRMCEQKGLKVYTKGGREKEKKSSFQDPLENTCSTHSLFLKEYSSMQALVAKPARLPSFAS